MKARFLVDNPDGVEFTMKITMSAEEWIELRDQLQAKWPSSRLSQAITSVISQIRETYYPKEEKDALP